MVATRRFAINGYGEMQDVFEETSVHPREIDSGHIHVEIKTFSVNPCDITLRLGGIKEIRTSKFPYVPGNDGTGAMAEAGLDVITVYVSDWATVHAVGGAYGEEVVLLSARAAKVLDEVNWGETAGMVTSGVTVYNPVSRLTEVQPTDTVMILGVLGTAGSSLIRLLYEEGIRVLTGTSSKNEEKIRKLGVLAFTVYNKADPDMQSAGQADLAIDTTKGSIKGEIGIQILKSGGRYIVLSDLLNLNLRQKKENFYESSTPRKGCQGVEAFTGIVKSYQKDAFHVFTSMNLSASLTHVIQAHQQVERHPPTGKIILSSEK